MSGKKKSREDLIKDLTSQIASKSGIINKDKKTQKPPDKSPESSPLQKSSPPPSSGRPFTRTPQPTKDYSKERISDKMFAGWRKALAKENSPERVEEIITNILNGKKKNFTGYVEVLFEDNTIVSVSENPVTIEEEVKEQFIDKSHFEALLEYLKNKGDAPPEIVLMAEGLSEEKIQKAIEIGAEHIIKKPVIKLDGSIQYNVIASVEDTSA